MIIECISDLHGHYPKLEGGDLLIVAGDLTATDSSHEYNQFAVWIGETPYKKKVVIGGNHDNWIIESDNLAMQTASKIGDFQYLCDSGTEFEGLKIWGSPWSLWFPGINPRCKAFTGSENDLKKKYELIPDDIDILVTHGPPFEMMDEVLNYHTGKSESVGSKALQKFVDERVNKLKLHVFGHIHEGYGINTDYILNKEDYKDWVPIFLPDQLENLYLAGKIERGMISVNTSHVNENYKPVNKPVRIEL